MRLDMVLQLLRTFECLAAELTFVRPHRYMHTDMRDDAVTRDGGGATTFPLTLQLEIVCALASDMTLADVVLPPSQMSCCQGAISLEIEDPT